MARTGFINVDIGDRDSGKTFRKIHFTIPKSLKKVLVVCDYAHPKYLESRSVSQLPVERLASWTGGNVFVVIDPDDPETTLRIIRDHVTNSTIIFEDVHEYTGNDISGAMIGILGRSKNVNNDVYLQYWCYTDVQPKIYRKMNFATIYRVTGDTPEDAMDKIKRGRYNLIKPIHDKVLLEYQVAVSKNVKQDDPRRYPYYTVPISVNLLHE